MAPVLKTLHELTSREDPGWPIVQSWLAGAKNPVEVLPPPDEETRTKVLINSQVTTRSPMGAIIYESGGILVDHGWIRILGSGHPRLPRSASDWNWKRSFHASGERPPFFLCADDVVGGFFAIDGGGLDVEPGKVCYFAPDLLRWENTGFGYSESLTWCFMGDLARYYETQRWTGWRDEVKELPGDRAYSFYPFLSCAGPPIEARRKKSVPVREIYDLFIGKCT